MRRLASILLVLALLLLAIPPASAEGPGSGDYEYELYGGGAYITRYTGPDTELTIPDTLGGHPVTSIGENAFAGNETLTAVTIPDCVEAIGRGAFQFMSRLKRANIGAGVTYMDGNPFYGSRELKYVEVAPGNPVYEVAGWVLFNVPEARLVTYPAGLTYLRYEIPEGTKIIGSLAFYDYDRMLAVTIPEGVESIEDRAFGYCAGLTEIIVPDSVTSIGREAFFACFGLERAVLGSGVRDIGINPFLRCTALKDIEIIPGDGVLEVREGALIYLPDMRMVSYMAGLPTGEYEVPEGVVAVGAEAFGNSLNLTSITLPEGVAEVGFRAFEDCPALTSVTLPEGVHTLDTYLFWNCPALTSVTLPDGLVDIQLSAFTDCPALAELTIPESVSSINDGAFSGCDALTLRVVEGSYAAKYAERVGIPLEYIASSEGGGSARHHNDPLHHHDEGGGPAHRRR